MYTEMKSTKNGDSRKKSEDSPGKSEIRRRIRENSPPTLYKFPKFSSYGKGCVCRQGEDNGALMGFPHRHSTAVHGVKDAVRVPISGTGTG